MNDPLIFLCKTGTITQPSKVALRKAGVIVVEAEYPADCSLMKTTMKLDGNQITGAALKALAHYRPHDDANRINVVGLAHAEFVKAISEAFNPPEP